MEKFEIMIIAILYVADIMFCIPKYTYSKYDHSSKRRKLIWKGVCIGIPLITLLYGTVKQIDAGTVTKSMYLALLAMALCAFGDIILEIRFIRGGALFFIGHIVYMGSVGSLYSEIPLITYITFLVLFTTGTVLTCTHLGKKYRLLLIAYNTIISLSFSMALPLVLSGEKTMAIYGMGICWLVISDWLLARNKVMKTNFGWSLIALVFYFGGQLMVATYPLMLL